MRPIYVLNTSRSIDLDDATGHRFMLLPGLTRLEPSEWDAVKTQRRTQDLIRVGVLRIFDLAAKRRELDAGAATGGLLAGYGEREAAQIIALTTDEALLVRFLDEETRKPVFEAIERRCNDIARDPLL